MGRPPIASLPPMSVDCLSLSACRPEPTTPAPCWGTGPSAAGGAIGRADRIADRPISLRRSPTDSGLSNAVAIAAGQWSHLRSARRRDGALLGRERRRAARRWHDHESFDAGRRERAVERRGDRRGRRPHVRAARRRNGRLLGLQRRRATGRWHHDESADPGHRVRTGERGGGRRRPSHTCALRADGTGRCWGSNSDGELGDNSTTERHRPGRRHRAHERSWPSPAAAIAAAQTAATPARCGWMGRCAAGARTRMVSWAMARRPIGARRWKCRPSGRTSIRPRSSRPTATVSCSPPSSTARSTTRSRSR